MGKITPHSLAATFRGALGDDLVFRKIGDRTFFSKKGVTRKPSSPLQTGKRKRFAEAQIYASQMLEQPEYSEWYCIVARMNGLRTAHLAAVKDFLSAPEIESINTAHYRGHAGEAILIKPAMLLKIKRLEVTLLRPTGEVQESGTAVKSGILWKYVASTDNPGVSGTEVRALAYDRFGKSGVKFVRLV